MTAGRHGRRRIPAIRRSPIRIALLLLLLGTSPGCGLPRPNLLLIVSDALRADVLECYGGRARTPNLCRLAERGVLFERAYATAPWTLPSAVGLFTGNAPAQYQRATDADAQAGGNSTAFYRVPAGERLLAERLSAQGYRVEGSLENRIAAQAGALRGFTLRSFGPRRNQRILADLDSRLGFTPRDGRYLRLLWALDFLERPGAGPFALLHWIDDPHAAYRPPSPYLEAAAAPGLPREVEFYLGLGHHDSPRRGLRKLRDVAPSLSAEELAFLKRLYRLEVESVDERVGYLLGALELAGQAEGTLVVFTSDHGEAFGEHGDFLHGVSLYDELVRVPLIVAGPGVARGRRVETPVSHLDLVPTLADLMGVEGLEPAQGRSLRRLLAGEDDPGPPRPFYLSSPDRLDRDAVVWGRHKLIAGGDGVEVYDLVADPGETEDLAAALPDLRRRLETLLLGFRRENELRWRARTAGDDPAALEEVRRETERALKAVGYLD